MTIPQSFRYACRRLVQRPGFTVVAVLSLAIGIGANTAIFSLVNAVLLRQVPLRAPEELYEVYLSTPDFEYSVFSYPDFKDLRQVTEGLLSGVAASRIVPVQLDRGGGVDMLASEAVSGNFFELLGLRAAQGRLFGPSDDLAPGAHPVVVLGYAYWQNAFEGDRGVVGSTLRLSGRPYTVIGVAPKEYTGSLRGLEPSLYVPMMMMDELQGGSNDLENRGAHSLFVKARLPAGSSLEAVQAAVDSLALQNAADDLDNWHPEAKHLFVPTDEVVLYPPLDRFARAAAWLLSVVVGLVLLMACTNLASFLLASALDRRKEIALKLALGATRAELIFQLLIESVVLAIVGGLAGIGLAVFLLRALLSADLPLPLPITLDLSLEPRVLFYTLAVSVVAGVVLGLAPAFQASRFELASTLKDEGAGGGQPGKLRLRNGLIAAQVAISTVLLVAAGLFVRSLQEMQGVDPGFGREASAVTSLMVPQTRYNEEEGRLYTERLLAAIREKQGVEAVGFTSNLHLNTLSTNTTAFNVDGVPPPEGLDAHSADVATVSDDFFSAVSIPILEGRPFDDRDTTESEPVVIISAALAERFWPGENAVGRMLRRPDSDEPDRRVIGIARDAKVRSLGEAPRPFIYLPYSQVYTSYLTVVARAPRLDAESLATEILVTLKGIDPDLWVWESKTMDRHLGIMLLPARLSALLLSAFAVLALALSAIGLYGIVSYAVARRSREIGIRVSLGARSGNVIRLMMTSGLSAVLVGGALGLMASVLLSTLLGSLLFGVSTFDGATFLGTVALLALIAVLSAWLPARRASRIEPMTALRFE